MKTLANYTNGYMILADSFNMSLFKQSFHRVFAKDEQGHLQMGFNATFDVQVRLPWGAPNQTGQRLTSTLFADHEGAQGLGFDRARDLGQQKVGVGRRDRDRYRPDVGMEALLAVAEDRERRLL